MVTVYNISGVVATVYDDNYTYINYSIDPAVEQDTWIPPVPQFDGTNLSAVYLGPYLSESYIKVDKALKIFVIVGAALTAIGIWFVLARLYVRIWILRTFFLDDSFIVVAMIASMVSYGIYLADFIISLPETLWYDTHSVWTIPWFPGNIGGTYIQVRDNVFYASNNIQSTFSRLSILYTFSRLAVQNNKAVKKVRIMIHIVAGFMLLELVPVTWLAIDPCWPPTGGRGILEGSSGCLAPGGDTTSTLIITFITAAAFNSVADLFCFTLPFLIFSLSKIAISKSQRQELIGLFGFGFLVFLVSIGRLVKTITWDYIATNRDPNQVLLVWAMGEANAVMIGACLPVVVKAIWRGFQNRRKARDLVSLLGGDCQELDSANSESRSTVIPAFSAEPREPIRKKRERGDF